MRWTLVFAFFCLALPIAAQTSSDCRGKPAFDLGDGARGCVLEFLSSGVTRTVRRDDGLSRSSSRDAVLIRVAVYGAYTERWPVSTPRMRKICAMFRDEAQAAIDAPKLKTVIVQMQWRDTPFPANYPRHKKFRAPFPVQAAFMNGSCRAIKYF